MRARPIYKSVSYSQFLLTVLMLLPATVGECESFFSPGGKFEFVSADEADSGFNDSELGDKRRADLVEAGRIWEEALDISVNLKIRVRFTPFVIPRDGEDNFITTFLAWACTSMYGSATGGTVPNYSIGYSSALSSQMAGREVLPLDASEAYGSPELSVGVHGYIEFNDNVENPALSMGGFHYGYPSVGEQIGDKNSFLDTATHEIGHILGFASRLSIKDGSFSGTGQTWSPGSHTYLTQFDAKIYHPLGGGTLLRVPHHIWDAYRLSVLNREEVCWGHGFAHTVAERLIGVNSPVLMSGVFEEFRFIRLQVRDGIGLGGHLYRGSGALLMEPSGFAALGDLDVALPMLMDMGWPGEVEPDIYVNKGELDFGDINDGDWVLLYKEIFNLGSLPLLGSVSIDDDFGWFEFQDGFDEDFELERWDNKKVVPIRASPVHRGVTHFHHVTGKLVIAAENDPDEPFTNVMLNASSPKIDSDGDLFCDYIEQPPSEKSGGYPFDPESPDSSGDNGSVVSDGIPDGLNDFDGDGFSNTVEDDLGNDPLNVLDFPTIEDFDHDGINDYDEVRDLDSFVPGIQNPLYPSRADADGNGVLDGDDDHDGDGIPNLVEFAHPRILNVLLEDVIGDNGYIGSDNVVDGENDFDGDGISNVDEIRYGLDPMVDTAVEDIEWQLCVEE